MWHRISQVDKASDELIKTKGEGEGTQCEY